MAGTTQIPIGHRSVHVARAPQSSEQLAPAPVQSATHVESSLQTKAQSAVWQVRSHVAPGAHSQTPPSVVQAPEEPAPRPASNGPASVSANPTRPHPAASAMQSTDTSGGLPHATDPTYAPMREVLVPRGACT